MISLETNSDFFSTTLTFDSYKELLKKDYYYKTIIEQFYNNSRDKGIDFIMCFEPEDFNEIVLTHIASLEIRDNTSFLQGSFAQTDVFHHLVNKDLVISLRDSPYIRDKKIMFYYDFNIPKRLKSNCLKFYKEAYFSSYTVNEKSLVPKKYLHAKSDVYLKDICDHLSSCTLLLDRMKKEEKEMFLNEVRKGYSDFYAMRRLVGFK